MFVGGRGLADYREGIADLRRIAVENGREPDDIKAFAGAVVIVGKDREAAERKAEEFRLLSRAEGYLAHAGGGGVDLAAYPPETVIDDIVAGLGGREQVPSNRRYAPGTTVGQALAAVTRFDKGFFAVGTPTEVVDTIEGWVRDTDLDGFNLRQFLTPGTAEDFIELVVPELQRRGLYRTEYAESTLRERLFGAGRTRLPDSHPGARYRGGRHLGGAPVPEPAAELAAV
ncbi:LLM class flavin-dependent oxidoreductase [Cellulomonas sp. ATA003]|uniref:LLM class flavin-dependent oxidoreductase n=1 Tax=Cellulomonas sp. ATA003 TaxID=3073064 RepID=UPI002872DC97|nr:LLM class flavin-dependent oxidoreductase [Cellulomonas sp. ATA003]WNB86786.1 LLM class flavin-dependent oxidoreductase [Cellulomonas sp. ATA003]